VALEDTIRRAPDERALWFIATNDLYMLCPHGQAVLFRWDEGGPIKPLSASGVAEIDVNAPMMLWITQVLRARERADGLGDDGAIPLSLGDIKSDHAREWTDHCLPHAVILPLRDGRGDPIGLLWLTREAPWSEQERQLLTRAGSALGHAWRALCPRRATGGLGRILRGRRLVGILAVVVLLVLAVPVPMTALGRAEVTPIDPAIIAAPMAGVIDHVLVAPDQRVTRGTPLLSYVDDDLRAELAVAERTRAVAEANLRAARQAAFDPRSEQQRIAVLEAELDLALAKENRARDRLARAHPLAPVDGTVILSDPEAWNGRPVRDGERILTLATPSKARIDVMLPVADAGVIREDAPVTLFLDSDPLHSHAARLESASYLAEAMDEGGMAYRLRAVFEDGETLPRIGARGVARVGGESVPLLYYLARRPLTALRQWGGW